MEKEYRKFFDESMLEFIKTLLKKVQSEGLRDDHHFYISFRTDHPSVVLSKKMRERYPEEITIVLQYNFYDLSVYDKYFSVKLSFDGVKETVEAPFEALTGFSDPSVKFSLQFRYPGKKTSKNLYSDGEKEDSFFPSFSENEASVYLSSQGEKDNVISFDRFRNKKKSDRN